MASRKEDERNERTIRSLLKLPENRRCINCNSLGPQYVCTNFSTFICTTCSGIHREFTHRVKSVSMAKFTTQEVSALQGGGNASARVIYLKEWDTQRNSPPDGSNVERLRDFIKHVYVDRRFTGEKTSEKPLREKMGESERAESYQASSRSPPYEDPDRRYGGRPSSGGRSPAYGQEIPRSSDNKRSPARPEVVHDWRREDRFGNGRMSDDRSSLEGRSPDSQRDSDMSSPPVVRPVREILGDSVSPLRVIEPPKATTTGRATDVSVHTQRTASSSSLASDGNSSEVKVEASFIDFDSVPEPPVKATEPQTLKAEGAASMQLAPSNSDNWANFDSVPQVKVTTAASNSLEALLGLSIPAPASGASPSVGISSFQSTGSSVSSSGSPFEIGPATSIFPPSGVPPTSLGPAQQPTNTMGNLGASTGGQWPSMGLQALPVYPGTSGQPASQPPAVAGSSSNMPWNQTVAPNARGPPGISVMQVGQAEVRPNLDNSLGLSSEHPSNIKSGERKELPADLFAMSYAYNPPPVSGWYPGAPYRPAVPMQYNMQMGPPNFQPVLRSTNPFDVSSEPSSFPSVTSLQGALPRIPSQAPAYAQGIPPNVYMGQEFAGGMAPRPGEPAFTSIYPNHQLGGPVLHHAHSAPSNFTSTSGNPFG